jgi:polysaccharide deacetylase 2 family uncharacterized protein YibQ
MSGCWKSKPEPLAPAQIHAITREFAGAASHAGPAGTTIWIANRASKKQQGLPDAVSVTPHIKLDTRGGRAELSKMVQALDAVATRHGLTQDPAQESQNGIKLTFRRGGMATHEIEIVTLAGQTAPDKTGSGAPLAIILDDLGNDRAAAEAIFSLPYPLTISILPNHPHSAEIAEEAHQRGYEVMVHLPMQAASEEKPESEELRPGMTSGQVTILAENLLNAVPYAVGVNNHQGSQATSDVKLMMELMPVLQERGLFYVDSRTAATTVAYDTARESGVRTAFRNVPFLDDVAEAGAVRKQLEIAIRGAKRKGGAVAIGHPHPATLQALREVLPHAESQGVRLVFASELVR